MQEQNLEVCCTAGHRYFKLSLLSYTKTVRVVHSTCWRTRCAPRSARLMLQQACHWNRTGQGCSVKPAAWQAICALQAGQVKHSVQPRASTQVLGSSLRNGPDQKPLTKQARPAAQKATIAA